jgi:hypothetical protein
MRFSNIAIRPLPRGGQPDLLTEAIVAIGKSTRRKSKLIRLSLIRGWRFLKKQIEEGAAIHNRATAALDDRYLRNFYYIRSSL